MDGYASQRLCRDHRTPLRRAVSVVVCAENPYAGADGGRDSFRWASKTDHSLCVSPYSMKRRISAVLVFPGIPSIKAYIFYDILIVIDRIVERRRDTRENARHGCDSQLGCHAGFVV